MKYILSILSVVFVLASCGERRAVRRLLAEADSLVSVCPDSALALLERADTLPLRHSERMAVELMRGKATTRAGNLITSDSMPRLVARYYDRWPHRDPNRRMLAHYYLGMAYRDMGSAPRALDEFQTADAAADTTSARCDLPTLMRVHSQMETIFMDQKLYDLQKKENRIAQELCWQIGDTLSALIFEDHLCTILYMEGQYEACIDSTIKVYNRFLSAGYPDNAALVCIFVVKSALELEDYPTMKKYLDIYQTSSYLKNNLREVRGGIAPLYNFQGYYYIGVNKLDSAEQCFRVALKNRIQFPGNELLALNGLKQVYVSTHQPDSALKYAQLYTDANVKNYNQENAEALVQMESLYDYGVEQKIAQEEKEKSEQKSRWIGLLVIAVLSALSLLLYVFYKKAKKEKQLSELNLAHVLILRHLNEAEGRLKELDDVHTKYDEAVGQLAEAERAVAALKKQYAEAHQKHSAQMKDIQEQLKENEETIILLKSRIGQFEEAIQSEKNESAEKQASLSSSRKPFDDYRADFLNHKLTEKHWENLKADMAKTYPELLDLLDRKFMLSVVELRVCMLVLLDFSAKDIDVLMERKNSFAAKTRQRLLKKVFGEDGSGADFDRHLRLMR